MSCRGRRRQVEAMTEKFEFSMLFTEHDGDTKQARRSVLVRIKSRGEQIPWQ